MPCVLFALNNEIVWQPGAQPAAPSAERRARARVRRQRQPQPRLPGRAPTRLTIGAPASDERRAAQRPAFRYSATFAALSSCPALAPTPNQRAAAFRSAFTPRPFS